MGRNLKLIVLLVLVTLALVPSVYSLKVYTRDVEVDNSPIGLVTEGTVWVQCNATLFADPVAAPGDQGTFGIKVNATIYDNNTVAADSADNYRNHYTNQSCEIVSNSTYLINTTCGFEVNYNAINGSNWVCNLTASDIYDDATNVNTSSNNTISQFEVSQLLSIAVSNVSFRNSSLGTDIALGDNSSEALLNITNYGNIPVNLTVKSGFDYAMNCSRGEILNNSLLRYNVTDITTSLEMFRGINLTNVNAMVPELTVLPQSIDLQKSVFNISWVLGIPTTGVGGQCNGSVDVTAVLP